MKNKIFLSLLGVLILTGCNNTCKEDGSYSTVLLPDTISKYELGIITYIEKEDTYNFKFYNFNMEYKSIEKGMLIDKDCNVIAYAWHEEKTRLYLKDNLEAYGSISYELVPNSNKLILYNATFPAIRLIK